MSSNEHFDAVVIGSGFGGSVMAYRLAEAGMRVCLLERGKAYPPNSFPRDPFGLRNNFWDPSEGLYGMFNVWSFKGSGALVSSGLGGGSLVYANILIRKDPKWFSDEDPTDGSYRPWPVQYDELEEHYGRVEKMMNAQTYPFKHTPYDQTSKTAAMREAAEKLGRPETWRLLNLAVSFRGKHVARPDEDDPANPPVIGAPIEEERPNYHAWKAGKPMPRSTCRLCGECDLGCNYGSKNTLDYTYITAAIHQPRPADVRTLCEVKAIAPRGDAGRGYEVTYLKHDPGWEGVKCTAEEHQRREREQRRTITCDRLVLAAGTFGTPYLLFKNHAAFPHLSRKLGSRFSVNGDYLSFIVNSRVVRDGKAVPRALDPSLGPVITCAIRYGDALDDKGDKGRGFYVEDGGVPPLLTWAAELSGAAGYLRRALQLLKLNLKYRLGLSQDTDMGSEIAYLLGDCATSKSSLPTLSMGLDTPDGRLFLSGKYLDSDWREAPSLFNRLRRAAGMKLPASAGGASQAYFDRVRREVRKIAGALGGKYMDSPSFTFNFHQVLTAHPLGGSPMARSIDEGVVNSDGEVFNYPGLYVADGSMLPGPVGPNPSLTIAALSDRFADRIIGQWKKE